MFLEKTKKENHFFSKTSAKLPFPHDLTRDNKENVADKTKLQLFAHNFPKPKNSEKRSLQKLVEIIIKKNTAENSTPNHKI